MDPFTGRIYLRGKPYLAVNEKHAGYLERYGLIECVEKAPAEQFAGADALSKMPKRRKRGGSRGAD